MASLVCVLMVQQTAGMTVAPTTDVALKRPFLFNHRCISITVMITASRGRLKTVSLTTAMASKLLSSGKYQAAILAR